MVRETRSRKVTLAVSADTEMLDVSNVNSSLSSSRKRTISDATKLEDPDREIEPTAGTLATASETVAPEPGAAEDMKEQDDAKEEEMTMKPPVGTKKAPIRKASGRGRGAASKDANVEDKAANTAVSKGDDEDGDDAPVVSDLVPVQEQEEQEAVTMPPKRTAPKRGRPRGTGARGRAASTTSRKPSTGRGRGRRKAVAEDEDDGDNDDDEDFHADQDTTSSSLPPPSQEPTRRSARSRAPPKDPYVETLAIEASKPKPKSQNPRGRGGRKKKMTPEELWSPENRVSQNSPFIRMDMTKIFNKEFFEKVLTQEQRDKIIAMLPGCDVIYPPSSKVDEPDPKPQIDYSLFQSPIFKDAVSQWKNDLAEGKYEPEYIRRAEEARRARMAGEFDSWKDEQFEQYWGQKQRLESDAVAGETAKVKIQDMIQYNVFKIGDIFSVRRNFAGGIVIRKEAKLVEINKENNSMTFTYPPGQNEWEREGIENKTVSNVISVTALETTLCREDGRAPEKLPNGNAFKTIRVLRKGEDIGCVFDLRARFYHQYLAKNADD